MYVCFFPATDLYTVYVLLVCNHNFYILVVNVEGLCSAVIDTDVFIFLN